MSFQVPIMKLLWICLPGRYIVNLNRTQYGTSITTIFGSKESPCTLLIHTLFIIPYLTRILVCVTVCSALSTPSSLFSMKNKMSATTPSSTTSLSTDDIYALVDAHGHHIPPVSTGIFLTTILAAVPVWLCVLPVSILYQTGFAVLRAIVGNKPHPDLTPIDSGIQVNVNEIIDRSKRKYDVILLGATGFTGGLAVEHLVKTYGVNQNVNWAIAGRSIDKLEQLKRKIAKELGNDDILQVDVLKVDTTDPSTLPTLVSNTRVVISTAGPFEKYGSPVVEFCAKYGTHYVDITGESDWVRTMILHWDKTAQLTGAKIVSMCGNDSIPWDLSVMKLEKELQDGETLTQVTCLNEFVGAPSGGTMDTIITNLEGGSRGAPQHAFEIFLMLPDRSSSDAILNIQLPGFVSKIKHTGRYSESYIGPMLLSAVNAAWVSRSTALRGMAKDCIYVEGAVFPNLKTALVNWFTTLLFFTMLLNPVTAYPIKKYFLPKPGKGPSRDDMLNKFYLVVTANAIGSKGTQVQSVMYFPRDSGYIDTARMVTESGLALALSEGEITSPGGFFTASTAVGMGQILLDRLQTTGTYFATKIVSSDQKSTAL